MIRIRPSEERGQADHGWLQAKHSFSFASYHDRENMGFGPLRVINQDIIAPGAGFPQHPHRDMEIITYITHGLIEHKDSMGNGLQIHKGEVQVMSAGTGVTHSEYNPDSKNPLKLLQIWIEPNRLDQKPRYDQKKFGDADKQDQWLLMVSENGENGSMKIHQDAHVFASLLGAGKILDYELKPGRKAWIQVIQGQLIINGASLKSGDGAAIEDEAALTIEAAEITEFLLFDLP